jgi:hypothetical protein
MTTTAERAETAQDHPAWCEGCTSEAEGGAGHFSDHQTIVLDLTVPKREEAPSYGLPYYEPATLSAYLAQPHGARKPTIHLTTDVEGDNGSVLTLEEAETLVSLLSDLIETATAVAAGRLEET